MSNASFNPSAHGRWWLPSLSATIWITLFLGLNLTAARQVLISADSDPALHRRLGEWMIQHRAILHEDNLLHTYQGPIITKEWLSEIAFAGAGYLFGWNGFVLVAATLIATCFWLLHRQLLAEECGLILATGLVFLAMFACSMHWLARPLLFTHLLTIVFAGQLRSFQQGRIPAWRVFASLPPLMMLWANLHGAFMTGLVLVSLYALGSAVTGLRAPSSFRAAKLLLMLLLVCCLASLVNPNGWRLLAHVLSFFRSPELSTVTTEFASPNFHTAGAKGFALFLLLLLLGMTLLTALPKLGATEALLVGAWGCFALFSARNIPVFVLVATPLLGRWLAEFVPTYQPSRWLQHYGGWAGRVRNNDQVAGNVAPIAVVVAIILFVLAKPRIVGGAPLLATDFPSARYPTAAVDYLRAHPRVVHGEMFNLFLWGGYLEFSLPERKPFIDSRNDFYGVELVREFRIVNEPRPGWEKIFEKYNVRWTILPVQHPLNRILELSPSWSPVFSNQQTLVFARMP